ncbi:hypothetical protein [Helicobacter ganmani]|uniref:hypothetical protein n=1 Tax=Helicobacter ganmani TaxID=60246 RepID=UPI003A88E9FE
MKTLSLIVRKRKTENGSFNSFSAKVGDLWYTVKFTQDCSPPPVINLDGNRQRAFVKLDAECLFDVKKAEKDTDFNVLYVSTYKALSESETEIAKEAEVRSAKEWEEKRMRDRMNFLEEL